MERLIIKGLESMTGELKGTYNGLHGSQSTDKGMTEEKAERLRSSGKLFQEVCATGHWHAIRVSNKANSTVAALCRTYLFVYLFIVHNG